MKGKCVAKSYNIPGTSVEVKLNGEPCYDFFFTSAKKEAEDVGKALVFNPTIIKQLTKSDCNSLSRLLIVKEDAKKHILDHLNEIQRQRVDSSEGLPIDVLDWDEGIENELTFKFWDSSKGYILNNGWSKHFVQRRNFGEKDIIGLRWDDNMERLEISLLQKHVPEKLTEKNEGQCSTSRANNNSCVGATARLEISLLQKHVHEKLTEKNEGQCSTSRANNDSSASLE